MMDIQTLARQILASDRKALAQAITLIESSLPEHRLKAEELLSVLPHAKDTVRIGISGIPGVGKSTFISQLGNWLLSAVHPVKVSTYTSIVRGYRREALERLELSSRGKEIHIEILDKAYYLGLSICEIPASLIWHKEHGKGGAAERKPKFNLFKIIYSHIVLAIFARPGIIFAFPGVALFSIGAYLTALFAHSFLKLFFAFYQQHTFNAALSMASREFYSQSQYSFMFASFCLILGIQFFIMYFLAIQNKKYFEENFRMLSRINSQLKVKK